MERGEKLLARMRGNAAGWRISDVEAVCAAYGARCASPRRGSHYKISHPDQAVILTIPSQRPIKPVYIRKLVAYLEAIDRSRS